MRMRHKPYARPELAAWGRSIDDPANTDWSAVYAKTQPLRLELGCGKGGFLAALALRDREYNFLGVDIKSEMLVVAKRNIERVYAEADAEPGNVAITAYNIEHITKLPIGPVDRIYINFCNPWYKSGHAKHRLTHPRQLVKYRDLLPNGHEIWFKTDDDPLFQDTLRYLPMAGFEVTWQTLDLHADEPMWNIRTEHENMFAAEGIKIKALIARKVDAELDKDAILLYKDV